MAVIILGLAEMNCITLMWLAFFVFCLHMINQAEVRNLEFTLKDPVK